MASTLHPNPPIPNASAHVASPPLRPPPPRRDPGDASTGVAAAACLVGAAWPVRSVLPGLAVAAAVGAVATVVGHVVPLVGTAVPGAVIGVVVALALTVAPRIAARRTAALPGAAPRSPRVRRIAAQEAVAAGRRDATALRARLAPGLQVAAPGCCSARSFSWARNSPSARPPALACPPCR